jgi:hypothetical protein
MLITVKIINDTYNMCRKRERERIGRKGWVGACQGKFLCGAETVLVLVDKCF